MFSFIKLVKWLIIISIYAGIALYSYQFLTGFLSKTLGDDVVASPTIIEEKKPPIFDKLIKFVVENFGGPQQEVKMSEPPQPLDFQDLLQQKDVQKLLQKKELRAIIEQSGLQQLSDNSNMGEILNHPDVKAYITSKAGSGQLGDLKNSEDVSRLLKLLQEAK